MKRLTISLALILCLVLCVFAFASCGKDKDKKPASSTTASGACAHEWGEYFLEVTATCSNVGMKVRYCKKCEAPDPDVIEIPKLAHTESTEYKTLSEPTCKDPGFKTKFCTVCGANLDETIESIPADSTKHKVRDWIVTKQPTLFDQTDGSRHGECTICHEDVPETLVFKYSTATWTENDSGYYNETNYNMVDDVLNGDHMYPTTEHSSGLDLLVEYSILWNETMLNLVGGNANPYITTQIGLENGTGANHFVYWSPVSDNDDASCKYAGGFEFGTLRTSEAGNPYPRMTEPAGNQYADFPNIGGTDQANPEWGWHRVQFRLHEEVTNLEAVKGGADAIYKLTGTIYIDGALVSILSGDARNPANRPYNVTSNNEGGVTYSDINEERWVQALHFNSIKAKDGTKVYLVYTDLSITIGTSFVQNVSRVASPAANEYTAEDGTKIPAPIYYTINP